MPFDVERVRRDTPACKEIAHFNNAGAALPPLQVTERVVEHLRLEAAIGGYEAHEEVAGEVAAIYQSIAELIGADPGEIALMNSATDAWDKAFYSFRFQPGDRILISRAEYPSNLIAYLQVAGRHGVIVERVDDDEHGQMSVEDLRRRAENGPVKLVSVTHVPTDGGLVNPAAEIGEVTRQLGIPFLLDACQSAGQLRLDVDEIGCDILTSTGRKYLRGPRGTGFLYVRKELAESLSPPFLDLFSASLTGSGEYEVHEGARRFESWEADYAARLSFGVAVRYAMTLGIPAIEERVASLATGLREQLDGLPGVTVRDLGRRKCGIVTFTVDGWDSNEVKARLRRAGIHVNVTSTGQLPRAVVGRDLPDMVRASVHYYNTQEELDLLCQALPAPR